jgi:hypothetical protein
MIKDHVVSSYHIEIDDLDYNPFDAQGGKWQDVSVIWKGDERDYK